jgi:DNA repair protein RecN (Recombination protein N)
MLHELRVENLLLLDRAELRLAPGLNVVTGETGAGKTLLAHALDLLLGGRARSGIVRGGAAEAYVEGVFSLPAELARHEAVPTGADELVLARRVWPDGRTRAYVCGRSATVSDLRELGGRVLAFYGQHEHRKLMLSTAQLDVLDAHCGARQMELRERLGTAYELARALEARRAELAELAGARERELDLLGFELGEIEAAAVSREESRSLAAERERLRHLETLRSAAAGAAEAVSPDGEGGVCELLARAAYGLTPAGEIDRALAELGTRVEALRLEAEDVGRELRSYALELGAGGDGDAGGGGGGRLEEVEERLALFARLERKHGGSIEAVLNHAARCRERIDELNHAEVALADADAELARARSELHALAGELGERRRSAAPKLASAVRKRLAELAMPDAQFEVELGERPDGCGPRGADTVDLTISTSAGVPAGPLREIASGGELSRVMLAFLSVAHGATSAPEDRAHTDASAGGQPLLVFDEIDAGIGGHTARAVGEHLRELARGRQILCITHLPQVAALAARHFTIAKDASTVPATTSVTALDGNAVVGELVRMLGGGEGDRAASQHARQLLRQAA